MNAQELAAAAEHLSKKRDAARAATAKSPANAEIDKLTRAAADLCHAGKRDEAAKLYEQRDALKAKRDADVLALSEELSNARVMLRDQKFREEAEALEALSVEELEGMRHKLTVKRKEIKTKLRAVAVALAKKQAAVKMKELWGQLSHEEKTALLATVGSAYSSE